jgi:hypothetical protein
MNKILPAATFAALVFAIGCNDVAKPPTPVANQAAVTTPALNTSASQQQGHDQAAEDDAPRITLADAKKDFDNKAAVFIDTHSKEQYELEHIPGAINIQPNTIKQNMDKVPKGKKLIVYCS